MVGISGYQLPPCPIAHNTLMTTYFGNTIDYKCINTIIVFIINFNTYCSTADCCFQIIDFRFPLVFCKFIPSILNNFLVVFNFIHQYYTNYVRFPPKNHPEYGK